MKQCITCKREFIGTSNVQKCCSKKCFKVHRKIYQQQEWYKKAIDESKKKYYLNNKEKYKYKPYDKDNPHINNYKQTQKYKDWQKKYMQRYAQTNNYKQIHKLSLIRYKQTPKGKDYIFRKRRMERAKKNCIIEVYTEDQWKKKVIAHKGFCPHCNAHFDNDIHRLTRDHIYAVIKAYNDFLRTGIKRIYTIDDMQPLCLICNSRKNRF